MRVTIEDGVYDLLEVKIEVMFDLGETAYDTEDFSYHIPTFYASFKGNT